MNWLSKKMLLWQLFECIMWVLPQVNQIKYCEYLKNHMFDTMLKKRPALKSKLSLQRLIYI